MSKEAQFLLAEIYKNIMEGLSGEKILAKFSSESLVNYDLIKAIIKHSRHGMKLNELELTKAIRNIKKIGGGIDDVYQYFGKHGLIKKIISKVYQINVKLTEENNDVSNLDERKDDDRQVIELNKIIEELKTENNLLKTKLQNVKLYDVIKTIDENQINGDQLIDNYKALMVIDIIHNLINNKYRKGGIIYYDNY